MRIALLLSFFPILATAQTLVHPPPLIRLTQTPSAGFDLPAHRGDAAAGILLIGMTAITGSVDTWELETHSSFAGLEQFDNDLLTLRPGEKTRGDQSRTLIAFHRQWWSYRPGEALEALRKARYMQVSIYRIASGSEMEFAELLRARKAALDSINIDRPDMVYQVISGAPSGTFLVFSPLVSLKLLDDGVNRSAAAYLRSTGSPSARASNNAALQSEISHENLIFRIDPRISSVSSEFAGSDPDFWKPKK